MSIKLISLVWDFPLKSPTEKLVLLALCDWANDKGESCYPSIKSIAEKSSISERQAQRIVHALIDHSIISIIKNENGGSPGQTRNYKININMLSTGDILTPVIDETGDICVDTRVTFETNTGDTHVTRSVKQTVNKEPLSIYSRFEDDFINLWSLWKPFDIDKGSKSKAKTSYMKARKGNSHETIIAGAGKYITYCHRQGQRTKHIVTWINQNGWLDEYPEFANNTRTSTNGKTAYGDSIAGAAAAVRDNINREESLWPENNQR